MSNPTQPSGNNGGAKALLRRLLTLLRQNLGFKVLAILLAILLWAGLITQDPSLTRERTFYDVNVNVSGSDTLHRNGFIVTSDLDEVLGNVTLRVAIPQMQYQTAQASNYNARIDLSRISEPGVQSVRITTTSTTTYGTVVDVSPAEVEIAVEEYVTRYRIPVRVHTEGSVPDGYYATTPTADPPMVTISGPRSLVERVVCAEATIHLDKLPAREGINRMAISFNLLDENDETIESNLLEITSESVLLDSVVIEQQLYSLKTLPLSDLGLIRGTPAAGYEVKSVSVTPDIITVAGSADVLAELDTLYPETYVDISGLSEPINKPLRVRDPGGLAYTSASSVTVAVEIGPIILTETFSNVRLHAKNAGSGLRATLDVTSGAVTISGPQLWMDTLRQSNISLYCDVSGLPEGTYQLPLICSVDGSEGQAYSAVISPSFVEVTIEAE